MKIGIIAEGPTDIAVIRNILKGHLNVDSKDTIAIRPDLASDETDLSSSRKQRSPRSFSNWMIVLEECKSDSIGQFLDSIVEDVRYVVIHVDTDQCEQKGFDVARAMTRSDPAYSDDLRERVKVKVEQLVDPKYRSAVRYAVSIEEMDAWILTIHNHKKPETGSILNAKKSLDHELNKAGWQAPRSRSETERYHSLSAGFREKATLDDCTLRSKSLRLFVESLSSMAPEVQRPETACPDETE